MRCMIKEIQIPLQASLSVLEETSATELKATFVLKSANIKSVRK